MHGANRYNGPILSVWLNKGERERANKGGKPKNALFSPWQTAYQKLPYFLSGRPHIKNALFSMWQTAYQKCPIFYVADRIPKIALFSPW
jgi:hypothetical protein